MNCNFKVNRKQLLGYLRNLSKVAQSARKRNTVLEFSLTGGEMLLCTPGISLQLPAQTIGGAKFTVNLIYFKTWVHKPQDSQMNYTLFSAALT